MSKGHLRFWAIMSHENILSLWKCIGRTNTILTKDILSIDVLKMVVESAALHATPKSPIGIQLGSDCEDHSICIVILEELSLMGMEIFYQGIKVITHKNVVLTCSYPFFSEDKWGTTKPCQQNNCPPSMRATLFCFVFWFIGHLSDNLSNL